MSEPKMDLRFGSAEGGLDSKGMGCRLHIGFMKFKLELLLVAAIVPPHAIQLLQ